LSARRFPSLKRRGSRDINKKLPFRSEAAGVVSSAEVLKMHSETFRLTDRPGCAISVASRLFISAQPPLLFKEGNLPGPQISLAVLGLVHVLVPNLGGDVLQLVHLAVTSLWQKSRIGIRVEPQRSRRHHPRLDERFGIFDGDFVANLIALMRQALHYVHLIGMEETAARQPGAVDERNGVEHQRVTLPAPYGVSHIRTLDGLLRIVLAAVGRNDAVFPVSAAAIGISRVEKDNVVSRLDDASRRAVPRNTQRLAGHNRIFFVRPHVELLNLV